MEQIQREQPTPTEINGFALASLIIGSISLFYADRLLYPNPRDYFLLSFVLPAAGIATAFLAYRRVQQDTHRRGSEVATAGAVLSFVSAAVLLLTKLFVY